MVLGCGDEHGPPACPERGLWHGQDLDRTPGRGISWLSLVPLQLFIEQKGLKKTSLVLEEIKFCSKTAASPP